jgi:hypothetical protein
MSYETRTWAWGLKALRPATKLTLMVLADVADEEGRVAYCSHKRMCTLTNQSLGTVKRILKELASLTLLVRLPRFVTSEGAVNHDGIGRQTSDGFLLHTKVTSEILSGIVAARTRDGGMPQGEGDTEEGEGSKMDPPEDGKEKDDSDSPGESLVNPLEEDSKSKITSPTPPKQGGLENEKSNEPSEAALKRFDEFKRAYPDGIVDLAPAKAAFFALPDADQAACVAGVAIYADRCRRRREKSKAGHLFVRKRVWENLAASVSEATVPTLHPPRSAAGRAITALHRIAKAPRPLEIRGMISYRHAITPRLLALADVPPEAEWIDVDVGTQPNGAWRAALDAMLEGVVRPRLTMIRVPWRFPPSVDGKIYSTDHPQGGPPLAAEMSEEDSDEFTKDF